MEDLAKTTPPQYRTLAMYPDISLPSTFLFLSSVFRTNLEIELIQRGGSLVNQFDDPNIIKRSSLSKSKSLILQSCFSFTLYNIEVKAEKNLFIFIKVSIIHF